MVTIATSTKEQDGFSLCLYTKNTAQKNKTNLNFPILLMHFNYVFTLLIYFNYKYYYYYCV